jgi:hypothetical protein
MDTRNPQVAAPSGQDLNHPDSLAAFRNAKLLVGGYLGIGLLTLVAITLMRGHSAEVNSAVWTRGVAVVASALVMYACAVRAARGSRSAYRRLRFVSAATVVAIAVIIALPGTFPLWMKLDQGLCGAVLIGVAIVVNSAHLRALFANRGTDRAARHGADRPADYGAGH